MIHPSERSATPPTVGRWATAARLSFVTLLGIYALAWAIPLPERLTARSSVVVHYADGSVAHASLSEDEKWRIDLPLAEVDPDYLEAVVQLEDERFWVHPGIDPIAIARAMGQNLEAGRVVSGGSTITMQLARMAEPRPRTLTSKLVEAARAVQLEIRLTKPEILEAYLRLVPYGRNVEGLEAASLAIFGHRADALTPVEIATLLAIPQDPTHRHPHPDHVAALKDARDRAARRLVERGVLLDGEGSPDWTPESLVDQVERAAVPRELRALPRDVPHAAVWLQSRNRSANHLPTTLDPGLQRLAARTLAEARPGLEGRGIHNASIVVVDHRTGEIEALVGSFDFFDPDHGGQIPAFAKARSPGSTLKPFVYAAAIDQGLALPEQLVPDVPVHFGSYSPDNYDGGFSGMVELEQALARSLNVPFVLLLEDLGVEPFLGLMRQGGARSFHPEPGHYGLSLVAGGIELTPLELTGLYVALANDGRARPLVIEAGATRGAEVQLFTPEAAWLTRRALTLRDRPDFPERNQLAVDGTGIHWKTGTSYGHRDAWAVGSGPSHTVAIWLGNLDNRSSQHLVGGTAAGPLLFDLLEAVGRGGQPVDHRHPPDLAPIEVCALSGKLPGPHCPHRRTILAPTRRIPPGRCDLHQRIEVDVATGQRVAPSCRAGRSVEARVAVVWPPEVRRWLVDHPVAALPDLAPECRDVAAIQPPRIVRPSAGAVALLVPGMAAEDQEVALQADAAGTTLSWFVDGEFLGRTGSDEVVWWTPRVGRHTLLVQDDAGATDKVAFEVRGADQVPGLAGPR